VAEERRSGKKSTRIGIACLLDVLEHVGRGMGAIPEVHGGVTTEAKKGDMMRWQATWMR
jgi:hypothetical protein